MDIKSGTLVANAVTTLTIDAYSKVISVTSHGDAGEEIWFTVDGSTPTVAGEDVNWTNGIGYVNAPVYTSATTVKLLSTSAVSYSVKGQ